MKHIKKFNEGNQYNCEHCHDEGKEPYCSFCKKSYLDELDRKKPSPWMKDEDEYPEDFPTKPGFVEKRMRQQKESVIKLAKQILDAAKLDVDSIEESDPDFIPYIADMIQTWYNQNR